MTDAKHETTVGGKRSARVGFLIYAFGLRASTVATTDRRLTAAAEGAVACTVAYAHAPTDDTVQWVQTADSVTVQKCCEARGSVVVGQSDGLGVMVTIFLPNERKRVLYVLYIQAPPCLHTCNINVC